MNKSFYYVFCLFFVITTTQADERLTEHTRQLSKSEQPGTARLADFQWLVGDWRGSGLGMQATESWTPAAAGTMVGTFRAMQKDKLVFSEFFMLKENNGALELRLKHFDADFTAWEEKDKFVTFKFIRGEKHRAYFEGLTYQLTDAGELHVWVAMKKKDGTYNEGSFVFQRVLTDRPDGPARSDRKRSAKK